MKFAAYDANSIYATGDTPEGAIAKARDDAQDDAAQFWSAPISDEFAAHLDDAGWSGNSDGFEIDRASGALIDTTMRRRDRLDAAAELMDGEIREAIHDDPRAVCPHWFLAEYKRRHLAKFGEEFRFA